MLIAIIFLENTVLFISTPKKIYSKSKLKFITYNQMNLQALVLGFLVIGTLHSSTVNARSLTGNYGKLSGIIIPGFASTQLRAWSILDCPFSPLDFNPLDLVWLDSTKLLSAVNCWLKCMLLDPYTQSDNPECKSRADTGLSAITEIDPGYITGPLSSVWKDWIKWCIEFGVEANTIIPAPYDWRLSPSKLEERDLYFHKLKLAFETALKHRGGPSIVFAHSLGNNVFRYFLEWLKHEIAPKAYIHWLDEHIHAYFAVGSPFLGSVQMIESTLSGVTFGLPVSEGTARLMSNSFASTLWMLPFSKYCRSDNIYSKHLAGNVKKAHKVYHCDVDKLKCNFSGWPTNVVNIEVPFRGDDAYSSFLDAAQGNLSSMECGLSNLLSFSAHEVSDGTFFKAIEDYDPDSKRVLYQLNNSYHSDPILNPLTPWERPPLKNIFCIYGVDSKTEVGYYFAPSGKPYPDNWIITDVIYEIEGSLYSRSGNLVSGNPGATSGDETVPYNSLSWCKTWLGPKVNITRAPQSEHDGSDIQVQLNVEHIHEGDVVANMTRSPRVKYITYFEDSANLPGKKTAVWELDKANHRNIVRSPVLMRELWLEMWNDIHPNKTTDFVTKAKRGPLRDEDCYWDYGKARCAWSENCEYRYVFGDVHLGQSCRLRNSSLNLLANYVCNCIDYNSLIVILGICANINFITGPYTSAELDAQQIYGFNGRNIWTFKPGGN